MDNLTDYPQLGTLVLPVTVRRHSRLDLAWRAMLAQHVGIWSDALVAAFLYDALKVAGLGAVIVAITQCGR